ncbi:MAG: hypothetical protein V3S21_04695 [Xanthomonadales bacterium]
MLNRRTFLQTASMLLTLPAIPSLFAGLVKPEPCLMRTVTVQDCADSEQFHAVFSAENDRIGPDIGTYLQAIGDCSDRVSALFGLTRSSDFSILSQLAWEKGYRLVYTGHHQYLPSGLQHNLQADKYVLDFLGPILTGMKAPWARSIAENAGLITSSSSLESELEFFLPVQAPTGSSGYLVSWAFVKG